MFQQGADADDHHVLAGGKDLADQARHHVAPSRLHDQIRPLDHLARFQVGRRLGK